MPNHKEIWDAWQAPDTLEECVKFLFERLDAVEVSDNGHEFHPTTFSSCRTWDVHRLGRTFKKMKELSGYENIHRSSG